MKNCIVFLMLFTFTCLAHGVPLTGQGRARDFILAANPQLKVCDHRKDFSPWENVTCSSSYAVSLFDCFEDVVNGPAIPYIVFVNLTPYPSVSNCQRLTMEPSSLAKGID